MLVRTEELLVIGSYKDLLSEITYLKVLTETGCESVKLPKTKTSLLSQLLQPQLFLEVELIKTAKNWIVNNIISYREITKPMGYSDFEKLANIQKILANLITDGQKAELLIPLGEYLNQNNLHDLDINDFENWVLANLGFLSNEEETIGNNQSQNRRSAVIKAKRDNHIE